MYHLADNYFESGKNIDDFRKILTSIDDANHFKKINCSELSVLTLVGETDTIYQFEVHTPGSEKKSGSLKKSSIRKMEIPDSLIDEMKNGKLLFLYNKSIWFVSANALGTLSSRIKLGGETFEESSSERDAYIASIFARHPIDITMMFRQIHNAKKIFSFHSGSYPEIRQQILTEILDNVDPSLGKYNCEQWTCSQNLSAVSVKFPDKADEVSMIYELPDKLVPGLYLSTSDTGDSSVTAYGCWYHKNTIIYDHVYRRSHRGEPKVDEIMKEIQTSIFDKYTKLPQRLCDLMGVEIRSSDLMNVYEYLFNHSYGKSKRLSRLLGQRLTNKILEEMELEINPDLRYTGYDVACTFLDLPSRLTVWDKDYFTQIEMRNTCGLLPYVDFENHIGSKTILV